MSETASRDNDAATSTFVSALIFNSALGAGLFLAFCILRSRDRNVYAPRTYMVDEKKRSPILGNGLFNWIPAVLKVPDHIILELCGLDAYVFLRFMRTSVILFAIYAFFSCAILIPINVTAGGKSNGAVKLAIANVPPESPRRWAHLVLTIVFIWITIYRIIKDLREYVLLRHQHLSRDEHRLTAQANTILVAGVPDNYVDIEKLYHLFSEFPGGIRRIFINRNIGSLEAETKERDSLCAELEGVITTYIMQSVKNSKAGKELLGPRPVKKIGWIPFCSPKVDAIDYLSARVASLSQTIAEKQSDESKYKNQSSVFIMFRRQIAAHMACQAIVHETPLAMAQRHLEIEPSDIIWGNLNLNPYERYIRIAISLGISIALVIFWSIPVTFVSSISSVAALQKIEIFSWIAKLPQWLLGVIQGLIPPVFMAILMMVLPIVLRILLRLEGKIRQSDIELALIDRYFFFLVVQAFLVPTMASGLTKAINDITENPQKLPMILAESLPSASIYFITYIILQSFTGAAQEVLQVVPLITRRLLTWLFPGSPRKVLGIKKMGSFNWGTTFPQHTLIFVIGLVYATINPVITLFAMAYFGLFYLVYRHQFLYVYDDDVFVTGGLAYPKAIRHIFVGLYLTQLCFLGLMILDKAASSSEVGLARLIIVIISLVFTIIAHLFINKAFGPVVQYMPVNLAIGKRGLEGGRNIYEHFDRKLNDDNQSSEKLSKSTSISSRPLLEDAAGSPISDPLSEQPQPQPIKHTDSFKRIIGAPVNVLKSTAHAATSTAKATTNVISTGAKTGLQKAKTGVGHIGQVAKTVATSPRHIADKIYVNEEEAAESTSEMRHRLRRYGDDSEGGAMQMRQIDMDDPAIDDAFTHPSLRTVPVAYLWIPSDPTGATDGIITKMVEDAQGWIEVVREGCYLDDKGFVEVEVDSPPEPPIHVPPLPPRNKKPEPTDASALVQMPEPYIP